ncbi:MAG: hypothetical protein U1E87_01345 [Alphaproteobacteria bacterium]
MLDLGEASSVDHFQDSRERAAMAKMFYQVIQRIAAFASVRCRATADVQS